jgi:hypothetical protein
MEEGARMQAEAQRYPALMTVAGIAGALGYIVIVIGLIATIVGMIEGFGESFGRGLWIGLLGVATTIVYAIVLFAIAEGIKVIVNIEENTRRSAGGI